MELQLLAIIGLGAISTVATALAAKDAKKLKVQQLAPVAPVVTFWAIITSYLAAFTLLRLANLVGFPFLVELFYLQTICGAMTIVALMYLIFGVLSGPPMARLSAEIVGGIAVATVTMIFTLGVDGPRHNAWGLEFLPRSEAARVIISAVYIVLPVAMSVLAAVATWRTRDVHLERRSLMFAAAVSMIFVPNAGKYVIFVSGPMSLALAIVTAAGAIIAWRAYK